MIDIRTKLQDLKLKAKELMKIGNISEYILTLSEINQVQLQLVRARK